MTTIGHIIMVIMHIFSIIFYICNICSKGYCISFTQNSLKNSIGMVLLSNYKFHMNCFHTKM